MSDLRDELEKNFASANLQSDETVVEQKDSIDQNLDLNDNQDFISAPKSYTKEFQENFKNLSPEWQKYLCQREKQTEKGFSEMGNKLNAYKWSDKVFEDRKQRLNHLGLQKAQDYIERLVSIDDALEKNPRQTLELLNKIYGVQENDNNNKASDETTQRQILDQIAKAQENLKKQQSEAALFDFNHFVHATDDDGNPKYPFYQDVKEQMAEVLQKNQAKTLKEAYDKAIWLNDKVRQKMIENTVNAVLNQKFNLSQNAKEASFWPKSKFETKPKEMTLREELEAQFRKEF